MGGMYVFPGGKVDDADCADAAFTCCSGLDAAGASAILGPDLAADRALGHFVAAIRETFEEAGVLVAEGAATASDDVRTRNHEGELSWLDLLAELDVQMDLSRLRYLDHWITPPIEPRRFTARFFLAAVAADQTAAHDERETTDGLWLTADEALRRYEDPEDKVQMAPPTVHTLQMMQRYESIDAAFAAAPHRPILPKAPRLVMDAKVPCLVLDGDPLHPDAPGDARRRFELRSGRWQSVMEQLPLL